MASWSSGASFATSLGTELVHLYVGSARRQFLVHKKLLTAQSEYFNKALNGRFREAEENAIFLKEDDPVAIEIFVGWLYTGNIPGTKDYLDAFDDGEDATADSCDVQTKASDVLSCQIKAMRRTGFKFHFIQDKDSGDFITSPSVTNYFDHISCQPKFKDYSPEELRMMDLANMRNGGSAITQPSFFPPVVVTSAAIPAPWIPPTAPHGSYWNLPFGNNLPLFYNPGTPRPITAGTPYVANQALFTIRQSLASINIGPNSSYAPLSNITSQAVNTRGFVPQEHLDLAHSTESKPRNAAQYTRGTNTGIQHSSREAGQKGQFRIKHPITHGSIIPGIPTSNLHLYKEEAAHDLALLHLSIFAEKIWWPALFNAGIDAYAKQTQNRPIPTKHVELIYTLTHFESPLRLYVLDNINKFRIAGGLKMTPKSLFKTSTSTPFGPIPEVTSGSGSGFDESDLEASEDEKAYQALARTNEDFCSDINNPYRTKTAHAFTPTIWIDRDTLGFQRNRRQSIYFEEEFQAYSPEELRLLDYEQSRKYGPSSQRFDSIIPALPRPISLFKAAPTSSTTASLGAATPTLPRTSSLFATSPTLSTISPLRTTASISSSTGSLVATASSLFTTSSTFAAAPRLAKTSRLFGTAPNEKDEKEEEESNARVPEKTKDKKCRYHMHEEGEHCEEHASTAKRLFGRTDS